jgi:hypothetical protein
MIVDRRFRGTYCLHNQGWVVKWLSTDVSEVRTASETSVDNHFTRQYNPDDSSEHHTRRRENLKSHRLRVLGNRVLRGIFGFREDKMTVGWMKIHDLSSIIYTLHQILGWPNQGWWDRQGMLLAQGHGKHVRLDRNGWWEISENLGGDGRIIMKLVYLWNMVGGCGLESSGLW